MPDKDGYPTNEELWRIKFWKCLKRVNAIELLEYVAELWHWPDMFTKKDELNYEAHTGGWSGNESLIHALRSNRSLFWTLCCFREERGGHFWFRLDLLPSEQMVKKDEECEDE